MARNPLRGHLSGSVPVSIAIHFVILLAVLIVPLGAGLTDLIALPAPPLQAAYMKALPVPPPPAVAVRRISRSTPASTLSASPVTAPARLEPESGPAIGAPEIPGAVTAGVPGGLGGAVPVIAPAVAPPPPAATIRVGQLPQPPRKIVDARPMFPPLARAARRRNGDPRGGD